MLLRVGGVGSVKRSMYAIPATQNLRIALVHDFLLDLRGAERVFLQLCAIFPQADIFTAVYDPVGTQGRFEDRNVITSGLQKLRPTARNFRPLLPFYPAAIESLDLTGYDLVISSSSAWAHGVIPDENAVHVCYCHNPFRYAWTEREATLDARSAIVRPVLAQVMHRWRQWDFIAAQRVDAYVANSKTTQHRIERYFSRESTVIYPPVEIERFSPGPLNDHHLVLSELIAHKRIEVVVRAFSRLGLPLVVAGDGPDARRLQRLSGPSVHFAGRVTDHEAERLLRSSQSLVVAATEEFGIAAVEAQASGRPVIALRAGGLLETVIEGKTGVFFDRPDPGSLCAALEGFDPNSFETDDCVEQAQRFSPERFAENFAQVVERTLTDRSGRSAAAHHRDAARRARGRGLARPGRTRS
jgi:glycosyltransferase involved in cell wall biosynthesis